MKKKTKKIIASFLAAIMVLTCMPFVALAGQNNYGELKPEIYATYHTGVAVSGKAMNYNVSLEGPYASVALSDKEVSELEPGDTLSVSFWLKDVDTVFSLETSIYYNTDLVEPLYAHALKANDFVVGPKDYPEKVANSKSIGYYNASQANANATSEQVTEGELAGSGVLDDRDITGFNENKGSFKIGITSCKVGAVYPEGVDLWDIAWENLCEEKGDYDLDPTHYDDQILCTANFYIKEKINSVKDLWIGVDDEPVIMSGVPMGDSSYFCSWAGQYYYTITADKAYIPDGLDNPPEGAGKFVVMGFGDSAKEEPDPTDFTVKYTNHDGTKLGDDEKVEAGETPKNVPALPTKAPDTDNHYTYAWADGKDPAATVINADTEFKVVQTIGAHNYVEISNTPATCLLEGEVVKECSVCKKQLATPIAPLGHTPGEPVITDGTCLGEGSKVTSCTVCNDVIESVNLGYGEHKYGEWTFATAGDCQTEGTETSTCSVCNDVKTQNTGFGDHEYETTWTTDEPADCTKDGSESRHCVNFDKCGSSIEPRTVEVDHGYEGSEWTPDGKDAEADGQHTKVCTGCGAAPIFEDCSFTGKVTQEATVDQVEITTYTCSVCGYAYTAETGSELDGVTVSVTGADMGIVKLEDEEVSADGTSKKYAAGDKITLTAITNDGCEFVGWKVGNKIVSKELIYTAQAFVDVTYTPVFIDTDTRVQAIFLDMYSNVVEIVDDVSTLTEDNFPKAPKFTGFEFAKWSLTLDEIKNATESMNVYALYTADEQVTYTVNAPDATISYNGQDAVGTMDVPYGAKVTVSMDGATAWKIGGADVAYGSSYEFYVISDVDIEGVKDTVTAKPVVTAVSYAQVANSHKVEFIASRSMAGTEAKYIQSGFVYGKNLTDTDMVIENVGKTGTGTDSGQIKIGYASYPETEAQFFLSYGITSMSGTACAKAFLTYEDIDGTIKTVYSNAMMHAYE